MKSDRKEENTESREQVCYCRNVTRIDSQNELVIMSQRKKTREIFTDTDKLNKTKEKYVGNEERECRDMRWKGQLICGIDKGSYEEK